MPRADSSNTRFPWARPVAGGVEIRVRVVAGASRNRIVGPLGDQLKVQIAAAPERGRANQSLVALLAEALGIAPKSVHLLTGSTSSRKTVLLSGVTLAAVVDSLSPKE